MPEPRYPTLDELWRRLDARHVEDDLRAELRRRATQEDAGVSRLPAATTVAVMARLLPGTIPPEALASFVDRVFDRQLGRADDKAGLLPRERLIPVGFDVLDRTATTEQDRPFADLDAAAQDDLLGRAEKGELQGPEGFDSATWFTRTRALALLGLGSDPRGMVFMGYPGPSYRPGHVWLDEGEVEARARRRPGYLTL